MGKTQTQSQEFSMTNNEAFPMSEIDGGRAMVPPDGAASESDTLLATDDAITDIGKADGAEAPREDATADASAEAPVKRGRGRPPGSKNRSKKNPEEATASPLLPATTPEAGEPLSVLSGQTALPEVLPLGEFTNEEFIIQAEAKIRGYAKFAMSGIVEIGRVLIEVKELLGYQGFVAFVTIRLGWSERSGNRFVSVAEMLSAANLAVEDLTIDASSLYLLARPSTPGEVRTEALEKAATEGISRTEVQKLIADAEAAAGTKAKAEADRVAAEQAAATKRTNEAAARKAAEDNAALAENIRQKELAIAQQGQRIAELDAAAATTAQRVRDEIAAQYEGKLVLSEAELRARVDQLIASLNRQIEAISKQRDEAVNELAEDRKKQAARIKVAAEKAAAAAAEANTPARPPIDSKLLSRAMDAGRAIKTRVPEIRLSPAECIAIELDQASRGPHPELAAETLGEISMAIAKLLPWFEQFRELYSQQILGEQPKAPTEDDDVNPDATRFWVNFGPSAAIARRLFQKLPPHVFREVLGLMCDLLQSNGVRNSTP
jgi:hypothetical protein